MSKIAFIGDKNLILGFQVLGISIYPARESKEAIRILKKISKEGYEIIYLLESLAREMFGVIAEFDTQSLPIITLIPDLKQKTDLGYQYLAEQVKKAVGIELI